MITIEKVDELRGKIQKDFLRTFARLEKDPLVNTEDLRQAIVQFAGGLLSCSCLSGQGITLSKEADFAMQQALCATALEMVTRLRQEQN